MINRRQAITGCMAAAGAFAAPSVLRAATGLTRFSVWREGDQIGSHLLRFTKSADELVVDIDINLVVKLLFIPVYDYKHQNQERWKGGRLSGFRSETDDNGDPFKVDAMAQGDVIISETLAGRFEHPATRRPTTYWHKSFLDATDWIDTQKGSEIICQTDLAGARNLDILGEERETGYFELSGDLKLNLWYLDDHWVKLTFEGEDGSVVEYRLEEFQPVDMRFA